MNTKDAKTFADRLTSDERLLKDLQAHSSSPEAIEAYMKSEGYEFTEPELLAALRERLDLYSKASLSDAELEGVSGGNFGGGPGGSAMPYTGGLSIANKLVDVAVSIKTKGVEQTKADIGNQISDVGNQISDVAGKIWGVVTDVLHGKDRVVIHQESQGNALARMQRHLGGGF